MFIKILKIIVLLIAIVSVLATGVFGQMAFEALRTQHLGAVLAGAVFLGYFLIAASVSLILLLWISFWDIAWFWNLFLGLEVGGLLVAVIFSAPIYEAGSLKDSLFLIVLYIICAALTGGFMKRAYTQYRLVK